MSSDGTAGGEDSREPQREPSRLADQLLDGSRLGVSLLRLPRVLASAGSRTGGIGSSAMLRAGHAMQRHLALLPDRFPHLLETIHYALAYANLDGGLITEHIGRRWEARTAVAGRTPRARHAAACAAAVAGPAGDRARAGVALGRTIPLFGAGLSVAAAAWSIHRANALEAEGALTGAAIERVHAVTDIAGVVPVVGPLVSVIGDIACICAHWFAGE